MSKYYCHVCAINLGLLSPANPETDFTGSSYQLGKFIKHTVPPTTPPRKLVSYFDSKEYDDYKDYIVSATHSGSVEIDNNNKTNVILVAGKNDGFAEKSGSAIIPNDSVKVVLHTDPFKIHAFPTSSGDFSLKQCANTNCSKSVFY